MTTVRLSQRNTDDIATTIQTGHDFTASTLVGRRARSKDEAKPNRYVIYTGDEILAILNTDDSTAKVTTFWSTSSTANRHHMLILQVLDNLGFWYETKTGPLEF